MTMVFRALILSLISSVITVGLALWQIRRLTIRARDAEHRAAQLGREVDTYRGWFGDQVEAYANHNKRRGEPW